MLIHSFIISVNASWQTQLLQMQMEIYKIKEIEATDSYGVI